LPKHAWKVYLADSSTLTPAKDITNGHDKTLTLSFNRSGNFSCRIPLNAENLNLTQTNQKSILVVKNENIVWSGPIWTRTINLAENMIEIACVGWFDILLNRYFYSDINTYEFTPTNEGAIAFALLNIANTEYNTWISQGSNSSTSLRTVKFEIFQSIGEEIINLSDLENGFDFEITPDTRVMNIVDSNNFTVNTNIVFGYNCFSDNVATIDISEDGSQMKNKISAVSNDNFVSTAIDTDNYATHNLMAEVIQLNETSDHNLVSAVAEAEISIKKNPFIDYNLNLKPYGDSNPYSLFTDYNLGDKISFSAKKYIDGEEIIFAAEPRIFGCSLQIDEWGNETATSLQTTFTG
jgi:hypothetical protein